MPEDRLAHMMKLTKHQHIVPNTLLSQFTAPDGKLMVTGDFTFRENLEDGRGAISCCLGWGVADFSQV